MVTQRQSNQKGNELDEERITFSRPFLLLSFVLLIAGALPLFFFWLFFGQAPTISPDGACPALTNPETKAVLVDTRSPEEYRREHIDGAVNWPFLEIMLLFLLLIWWLRQRAEDFVAIKWAMICFLAGLAILQRVSRWVTPPGENVNLALRVHEGWDQSFLSYPVYMIVFFYGSRIFFCTEKAIRKTCKT